jgi:hypothetical protein
VSTLGFILAIAYLPGALAFRLPTLDRSKRAALPAEERLFWAVMISVIVSSAVAFALAGLGAYTLGRLVTVNVVLTIVLAAASGGDLRLGSASPRPTWTAALPAALIALGAWMYFAVPAAEYVMGGRDPGVYMSEGIQIAQRRALMTTDPVVAAVPAAARDIFFPMHGQDGYYSIRYMGFHLRDPDIGTVSGQFPQGYPIWIAIAYGLDGVTGTRRVIAWWAILGVLAVYFAARRLCGPVPAAAAAGLLSVHVIQTWFARYPNSEIVTQALIFPALLAHAYAHEDEDRFFGPVAASLAGLALFTRLPAVIAVGPMVLGSLLAPIGGHRARAGFLVTLAAWMAVAAIYYTTQLRPYFSRPIEYVQSLQPIHLAGIAAAGLAAGVLLLAIRQPRIAAMTRQWLPRALIAMVGGGSIYAMYFREPGVALAAHDAYALRMFGDLYVTRIALGLAVVGYGLVVWRSFWRAAAFILTITTLSLFFFYKMRIWPEQFWLARRFLTEILPATFIFVAAALFAPSWIEGTTWKKMPAALGKAARPVLWAIGILAVILLGRHYLAASKPIRTHIEYAGIIPKIEQLAAGFGDNDLVLVDSREASDTHVLALPLAYIYARNVLVLANARPDKPTFARFFDWAREHYENIYLIAGGGVDLLSPGIASAVVSNVSFQVPEYERTPYNVEPHQTRLKPFDFTIYRILKSDADATAYSLDVGGADDLHLLDFHPKERLGGRRSVTFRWTKTRSQLLLGVKDTSRDLVLRLSSGRPRGVAHPSITVRTGGHELGTAELTNEFQDYVFPLPSRLAADPRNGSGPMQFELETSTWRPSDVFGGSDSRQLGVMVDRAEIR